MCPDALAITLSLSLVVSGCNADEPGKEDSGEEADADGDSDSDADGDLSPLELVGTVEDAGCDPGGAGSPRGIEAMPDGSVWVGIASAEALKGCFIHLDSDLNVLEELEQPDRTLGSLHSSADGHLWALSYSSSHGVIYELQSGLWATVNGFTNSTETLGIDDFGGLDLAADASEFLVSWEFFDYYADKTECSTSRYSWNGSTASLVHQSLHWFEGDPENQCSPRGLVMAQDGSATMLMRAFDWGMRGTDREWTFFVGSIEEKLASNRIFGDIEHGRIDDAPSDRMIRSTSGDVLVETEYYESVNGDGDKSDWRACVSRVPAGEEIVEDLGCGAERRFFGVSPEGGLAEARMPFGVMVESQPVTVRWYEGEDPSAEPDLEAASVEGTNIVNVAVTRDRVWLLLATEDWETGWRVAALSR